MNETNTRPHPRRSTPRVGTKMLLGMLTSEGGSTVIKRGSALTLAGIAFFGSSPHEAPTTPTAPASVAAPTGAQTRLPAPERQPQSITIDETSVNELLKGMSKNTEPVTQQQLAYMQLAADTIQTTMPDWYSVQEINNLIKLWWKESRWTPTARNHDSGAYGIPQRNPAAHGLDTAYIEDPLTQIQWGIAYIRYKPELGSPSGAWNFSEQHGWY